MWTMPVLVMGPAVECLGALEGVLVGVGIGPFAKRRLDEALSLAVGLRPVGSREAFGNAHFPTSLDEGSGTEGSAVVREQATDRHAQARVVRDGIAQERDRAGGAFVGMQAGEAQAGMVVHGHEQVLPACTIDRVTRIAG